MRHSFNLLPAAQDHNDAESVAENTYAQSQQDKPVGKDIDRHTVRFRTDGTYNNLIYRRDGRFWLPQLDKPRYKVYLYMMRTDGCFQAVP